MVKQSVINTAIKFIRQIPADIKVKKVYLFGSCAKGLEKEDSDIDIALVVENMTDFFSTQMQLMRTRRNVDLRIEPHPIDESDFSSINPFAAEIQKSGIEIPMDLSNVRAVVVRN
ncbi:MAG: nucleotidyltransferase domain-containing protein [Tunicatimonas sp.]